ncbi:MAG TPA: glycosyltransferase [Stellaceae bacterium]|nr:glycosyltransferase [Stellaceae bacterium]
MTATIIGTAAAAFWAYLIALRGGFWRIRTEPVPGSVPPRKVAAVIPARDEAAVIGRAVSSLLAQHYPGSFHLIIVDDHSSDGTAAAAQGAAAAIGRADRLSIIHAAPVPLGWTGKLWAVRHGIEAARALEPDYLLLTDADIVHAPDNLAELVARAEHGGYNLVSLMVKLHCRTAWERLLIPAFVFFFLKLYPPRHVADPGRRTAAAAGGCMLIRRETLDRIGGVDSIRREIIDDCALARRVKAVGKVWLGAAADTVSIREYGSWRPIWDMIARCAFAQLGYSAPALLGTTAAMAVVYLAPPVLLLAGPAPARVVGAATWAGMSAAFVPVLRLYRVPVALAPLLPAAALFYTAATVWSAVQYWRGRGGRWKGRFQAAPSR